MNARRKAAAADFMDILAQASRNNWRPQCYGNPGPYMDYDEDNIPSNEEAEALCAGCPLKEMCEEYALKTGETHGVWGGKVFDN